MALRTVVTFQSAAFNTSQRRSYFINDGCYGDDVARWLMSELKTAGIATDPEPGQEDFGWYFTFRPGETDHDFVLSYRPEPDDEPGTWIGWMERSAGLLASVFGGRARGIDIRSLQAIHNVLKSSEQVSKIRWHRKADFDAGNEAAGSPEPDAA